MPLVFLLAHEAFSNPQVALFGAFGSFALLLLVEFTGPPRARLASYAGLYLVGACFTVLGTVVSTNKVLAVVAMAVVVPTFMEVLDTTIANVALRYIAGGLSASNVDSEWVLTSYLAANATILPISGWLR